MWSICLCGLSFKLQLERSLSAFLCIQLKLTKSFFNRMFKTACFFCWHVYYQYALKMKICRVKAEFDSQYDYDDLDGSLNISKTSSVLKLSNIMGIIWICLKIFRDIQLFFQRKGLLIEAGKTTVLLKRCWRFILPVAKPLVYIFALHSLFAASKLSFFTTRYLFEQVLVYLLLRETEMGTYLFLILHNLTKNAWISRYCTFIMNNNFYIARVISVRFNSTIDYYCFLLRHVSIYQLSLNRDVHARIWIKEYTVP